MKLTKVAALALSLALTACAAGCSGTPAGTDAETTPETTFGATVAAETSAKASESSVRESGTGSYAEKPVASASDTEGGKLVIWSFNDDFKKILEQYSPVKDYEYVVIPEEDYQKHLEEAFSTDEAPDMFVCGYDNVKLYAESDKTLPINTIGISNQACGDMYDYSLRLAADSSGSIKGLAWELEPGAVFYQKSLAQQYLGTSDPVQVSNSFSSWESFMQAARKVSKGSEGNVRIVAGTDGLYRSFMGSRTTPWISEGKMEFDNSAVAYLGFARTLGSENLTFGHRHGSDEWKLGMRNRTVLSYWGPLSLVRSSHFALDPTTVRKTNPTSGDWGIIRSPSAFAKGGTWVMVSVKCDMKKSCADIITAVCLEKGNLKDMLSTGRCDFVNSRSIIADAATDDRYSFAWLGGQNPYEVLGPEAERIDVSLAGSSDSRIDDVFTRIVKVYAKGGIKTITDAKATFREILIEKKIVQG